MRLRRWRQRLSSRWSLFLLDRNGFCCYSVGNGMLRWKPASGGGTGTFIPGVALAIRGRCREQIRKAKVKPPPGLRLRSPGNSAILVESFSLNEAERSSCSADGHVALKPWLRPSGLGSRHLGSRGKYFGAVITIGLP